MMNTPISDFIEKYTRSHSVRLHMPGHKGVSVTGAESRDITEIDGADVLYSPNGIIAESEGNASKLFGTRATYYSTEGSSLCIRAMVYLIMLKAKSEGKKPIIWAGRNAHKTFVSALGLLDVSVEWLFPNESQSLVCCELTADFLDEILCSSDEKPTAIYITSPDYLGNIADVEKIAAVCRRHGVLLAVDNAHGAYLKFLSASKHPIDLGADICCDSAHKTLPCLTGGAYLHISRSAPEFFSDMANSAMSLFASTSPSYLILDSLDRMNAYLSNGYEKKLKALCEKTSSLKKRLSEKGFSLVGDEMTKLTVFAKSYGYFGFEIAEILKESNIICEFCDRDFVTMMFTAETTDGDMEALEKALLGIQRRPAISERAPAARVMNRAMSVKEALTSPARCVLAKDSVGLVLAAQGVSCPPAIPILLPGEIIDEVAAESFIYYGVRDVMIVDNIAEQT